MAAQFQIWVSMPVLREIAEGGMMDKCQGVLGKLFGHSYRPVITKGAVLAPNGLTVSGYQAKELIDALRAETYCGLYCKRCGKVINA
ncbi:hypothetical protein ACXYCF_10940 [Enterobacter hormaechei subsp. xiangfangensis]